MNSIRYARSLLSINYFLNNLVARLTHILGVEKKWRI